MGRLNPNRSTLALTYVLLPRIQLARWFVGGEIRWLNAPLIPATFSPSVRPSFSHLRTRIDYAQLTGFHVAAM